MYKKKRGNNMLTHWGLDNGWYFTDNIFKMHFLDENVFILIQISLNFPENVIDI